MGLRQVVLDTETTGLRVEDGHRIIEVGCVELIDRKLTGRTFHKYINPEREVEAGALAVHGITNERLANEPIFSLIVHELIDFLKDAELIIHNAPFDLGFLNNELMLCRHGWQSLTDYCQVIDTLLIARKRHIGQRNSLDALCKRYGVDNSNRDYHGALLDANLLAHVYLAMTGGQGSFFDSLAAEVSEETNLGKPISTISKEVHNLPVITATAEELEEHHKYLEFLSKKGKCLWQMN